MPLSEHEQRILDEIERRLSEDDPAFVEQVGRTDLYTHLARRIHWSLIGLGIGLILSLVWIWFDWPVGVGVLGFLLAVLSAWMLYRCVGQLTRDQLRLMQDEGFTVSGLFGRIAARFRRS